MNWITAVYLTLKNLVASLKSDVSGATAIEYGLIAALVAVAIIGALSALGTELVNIFNAVTDQLSSAQG